MRNSKKVKGVVETYLMGTRLVLGMGIVPIDQLVLVDSSQRGRGPAVGILLPLLTVSGRNKRRYSLLRPVHCQ